MPSAVVTVRTVSMVARTGTTPEMLFGEYEVLVAATHQTLLDGVLPLLRPGAS